MGVCLPISSVLARMAVPAKAALPIKTVPSDAFRNVVPAPMDVVPRFISTGAPAKGLFCKSGSNALLPSWSRKPFSPVAGRMITRAPAGAIWVAMVVPLAPVVSIVMVFPPVRPVPADTKEAISIAFPSNVTSPPLVRIPAKPVAPVYSPLRSFTERPRAAATHTAFTVLFPDRFCVVRTANPLVLSPNKPISFPTLKLPLPVAG